MAWRLFLTPLLGSVGAKRAPKYVPSALGPGSPELAGTRWWMTDYGNLPWCLLAADVDAAQLAFLSGQPDVRVIPANLDSTVGGGNVAAVRNALRAANLPNAWVTAGTNWRTVIRAVGGVMKFAARYAEMTGGDVLIPNGTDLNLTMGSLTQERRDNIQMVANWFGYDTSSIIGSTTIEQALKILADQWGDEPFIIGDPPDNGMTF